MPQSAMGTLRVFALLLALLPRNGAAQGWRDLFVPAGNHKPLAGTYDCRSAVPDTVTLVSNGYLEGGSVIPNHRGGLLRVPLRADTLQVAVADARCAAGGINQMIFRIDGSEMALNVPAVRGPVPHIRVRQGQQLVPLIWNGVKAAPAVEAQAPSLGSRPEPTFREILASDDYAGPFKGLKVIFDANELFGGIEVAPLKSWNLSCTRDRINDAHYCDLTEERSHYINVMKRRGSYTLVVGEDHYPGSTVALRIDRGQPLRAGAAGWTGPQAAPILAALRRGKSVAARYTEWPNDGYTEDEVDLAGFDLAIQMLDKLYALALAKWK